MTCATRVTRGTIDFQARDNFELRDKEFARKFQVRSTQSRLQAKVSRTYSRSTQSSLQAEVNLPSNTTATHRTALHFSISPRPKPRTVPPTPYDVNLIS